MSGAAVMDLHGGMVRAETSDYDEFRLDTRTLPSSCTVYGVPGPDNVLDSRTLSALFRAYVDDITKQRGCTHVTYPDAKDFRTP